MAFPRRVQWLEGKYANVDGIPFTMPIGTHHSPALFAGFSIDADAAAAMLPGQELHPVRVLGRGVLVLAVVNYVDTTIGKYVEFCIGILAARGYTQPSALPAMLLRNRFGTGVYIYDLPVSTEISVKGGIGIWGMPKRQGNLDFLIGDDSVSTQYDLDGQLVMRLDVPKPSSAPLPLRLDGVGWGDARGMLCKSDTHLQCKIGVRPGGRRARLLVGDHPRMEPIKRLHINPRALFTGYAPTIDGVLDDHVETWYLTSDTPPPAPPPTLRDVAELTLSQEWLEPPDRITSDRLMAALSPRERVGERSAPLDRWLVPAAR
jgi:hypothetical protein